ncbi:MAG: signal peptidase I [Actinobacteria bacterium]|nr:signal peptidase I [Actinomycetota bacterium]
MAKEKRGSLIREFPMLVVVAVIVSIIIKTFLVQFFYIPSGSMENTLLINDRVAVNKLGAFFTDVKRGEVVVFRDTAGWLTPESVESGTGIRDRFKSALVFIGILPDPAKQYLIKRVIGVGGDRILCCDAQKRLFVPLDAVTGRAFAVVWPIKNFSFLSSHNGLVEENSTSAPTTEK